jgi:hypothetical protein
VSKREEGIISKPTSVSELLAVYNYYYPELLPMTVEFFCYWQLYEYCGGITLSPFEVLSNNVQPLNLYLENQGT